MIPTACGLTASGADRASPWGAKYEVTSVAQCLEKTAVGEGDRFVECAQHAATGRAHAAYLRAVQSR